ncbi:PIN domain-containing protein [Dyadobacter sp. OTU695]|uniref:PIN domain-containing protein n=1 Tax=Dyadobacter sp. OTU695 TaxID=3043860 RepID=UPI00313D6C1D
MIETKQMILSNTFLDSNILIYLMDDHLEKRRAAEELLAEIPCVNAQVLVEVGNVCKRKLSYTKHEVSELWYPLMTHCKVAEITETTIADAIYLSEKYDFQLFDAIVVSGALDAVFYTRKICSIK